MVTRITHTIVLKRCMKNNASSGVSIAVMPLEVNNSESSSPLTLLATTANGRSFSSMGSEYAYEPVKMIYGSSRHMTFLFNLFVFLQVFNFINSRKIKDEVNVFGGITKSPLFILIVGGIFFLQIVIILIGNRPMSCSPHVNSISNS